MEPGTKRSRLIRDESTKLPSLSRCSVGTLLPVSAVTFDRRRRHPLEERVGPALPIPQRVDPGATRMIFGLALGPARTQMPPGEENDAERRKSRAIVPVECGGIRATAVTLEIIFCYKEESMKQDFVIIIHQS